MKVGYSIILGEYIGAESLSYRDCEPFQVVCPNCREPLFKVVRKNGKGVMDSGNAETSYLSHYSKSSSFNTECELRVSSITATDKGRHNTISRDQRLSHFLEVFISALERDPYFIYRSGIAHSHKQINRSKGWRVFRDLHYNTAKNGNMATIDQFTEYAEFYLKESEDIGTIPKTGFSTATQIRIASDMMALLLTDKGKSNYKALYNHASVYLLQRCENRALCTTAESVEVTDNVVYFVSGLMRSGKAQGLQLIADMNASPINPPFVASPANYMLKVASEIAHEMVGALVRLPYFEILGERVKGEQE